LKAEQKIFPLKVELPNSGEIHNAFINSEEAVVKIISGLVDTGYDLLGVGNHCKSQSPKFSVWAFSYDGVEYKSG